jgi:hypothetical protein
VISDDEPDRQQRARARSTWPVRKLRLEDDHGEDLSASTTAEERLAMVEILTREAWSLAGLPLPHYSRAKTPMVIRRGASS